jgi:hypothetical protein
VYKLRSLLVEEQLVRFLCRWPYAGMKMDSTMGQKVDVDFCVKLQKLRDETLARCLKQFMKYPKANEATDFKVRGQEIVNFVFSTTGESSTLRLCPGGPSLIRNSTCRCWEDLVMP